MESLPPRKSHEFRLPVVIEIELPKTPTEHDDFIEAFGRVVITENSVIQSQQHED